MSELMLTAYLIDTVRPYGASVVEDGVQKEKVQMVTFSVLGQSAEHALDRFLNEEAGEIIYEGEPVDSIITGMQLGAEQPIDVSSIENIVEQPVFTQLELEGIDEV